MDEIQSEEFRRDVIQEQIKNLTNQLCDVTTIIEILKIDSQISNDIQKQEIHREVIQSQITTLAGNLLNIATKIENLSKDFERKKRLEAFENRMATKDVQIEPIIESKKLREVSKQQMDLREKRLKALEKQPEKDTRQPIKQVKMCLLD